MAIIKPVSARRTVHLSVDELKKLKAKRKLFHTATELSQHLNIGLPTLRRIMELGRGSEPIIDSIKQAIS